MPEPKFKAGQLVKYTVGEQVRYNAILAPVWNSKAGCYLYRLDEPMAMPVYREDWLMEVNEKETAWLVKELDAERLCQAKMGYIYHREGKIYSEAE